MSTDEDTELRDLVAEALESNGVLQKIRAELRSSVFLALEDQQLVKNKAPLQNPVLLDFLSTNQGRQIGGLVREFLQFFSLDFTLAVFEPEVGFVDKLPDRESLIEDLRLSDDDIKKDKPLLSLLLKSLDKNSRVTEQDSKMKAADSRSNNAVNSSDHVTVQKKSVESDLKKNVTLSGVSHSEEIEEDILEEFSTSEVIDDRSGLSGEVTTDRTISPTDRNDKLDYTEDIFLS